MSAPSAHWTNDPHQGSAFHELVILPTLTPNLACPYYTPGTPEYYAAEAVCRQEAAAVRNPGLPLAFAQYALSNDSNSDPSQRKS